MKEKAKMDLIRQIKECLTRHGYKEDNYGNMKKSKDGVVYRYKFNPNALRKECQYKAYDGAVSWQRITSGFYHSISISADDKILGMSRS